MMKSKLLNAVVALGLLALPAVGGTDSNSLSFRQNGSAISGTYNPIGVTKKDVIHIITLEHICSSNELSSYTETTQSDGQIAFQATCKADG